MIKIQYPPYRRIQYILTVTLNYRIGYASLKFEILIIDTYIYTDGQSELQKQLVLKTLNADGKKNALFSLSKVKR